MVTLGIFAAMLATLHAVVLNFHGWDIFRVIASGESHRARANHGNINSMADAELVHTYGSMAIDMMYHIHEIVSVGDGNKQIDWYSEDDDKDGSKVGPMIDFGVSLSRRD